MTLDVRRFLMLSRRRSYHLLDRTVTLLAAKPWHFLDFLGVVAVGFQIRPGEDSSRSAGGSQINIRKLVVPRAWVRLCIGIEVVLPILTGRDERGVDLVVVGLHDWLFHMENPLLIVVPTAAVGHQPS